MIYKIESPFVLIHALKNRESCSIAEIAAIKRKVEKEIPLVYLDVSRSSILATISFYPEIFFWDWEEERIKRKDNADRFFQNDVMILFNDTDMDDDSPEMLEMIKCIENDLEK